MKVTVDTDSGTQEHDIDLDDKEEWLEHQIDLSGVLGTYQVQLCGWLHVITLTVLSPHMISDSVSYLL